MMNTLNLHFKVPSLTVDDDIPMAMYKGELEVMNYRHNDIKFFVHNHELYAMVTTPWRFDHNIYKYNQHLKSFSKSLLCLTRNSYHDSPGHLKIPADVPKAGYKEVITTLSNEYIYIFFTPHEEENNHRWLFKVNIGKGDGEASMEVEKIEGINMYPSVIYDRDIYSFDDWGYNSYNFDTKFVTRHYLPSFDFSTYSCGFCVFQDKIYAIAEIQDDDDLKIRFSVLDTEDQYWVPLSEHVIEHHTNRIQAVSSPEELIVVMNVRVTENRSIKYRTYVYCYDTDSNDLFVSKECVCTPGNEYLFIPNHLFE